MSAHAEAGKAVQIPAGEDALFVAAVPRAAGLPEAAASQVGALVAADGLAAPAAEPSLAPPAETRTDR